MPMRGRGSPRLPTAGRLQAAFERASALHEETYTSPARCMRPPGGPVDAPVHRTSSLRRPFKTSSESCKGKLVLTISIWAVQRVHAPSGALRRERAWAAHAEFAFYDSGRSAWAPGPRTPSALPERARVHTHAAHRGRSPVHRPRPTGRSRRNGWLQWAPCLYAHRAGRSIVAPSVVTNWPEKTTCPCSRPSRT